MSEIVPAPERTICHPAIEGSHDFQPKPAGRAPGNLWELGDICSRCGTTRSKVLTAYQKAQRERPAKLSRAQAEALQRMLKAPGDGRLLRWPSGDWTVSGVGLAEIGNWPKWSVQLGTARVLERLGFIKRAHPDRRERDDYFLLTDEGRKRAEELTADAVG